MNNKNKNPNVPNLRFPNFYEKYVNTSLSSLLFRVSNPVDVDLTTEYYQIGIRSHGKGLFYKGRETGKEIGNKKIFWIEPDCLIVNIVFAWERAVAKTTNKEIGMVASHRFPMYKVKNSSLDYLLYYLKTDKGKELLELSSPGGAGRNKTLNLSEFLKNELHFPSLEEQKKVAHFLTLIDERIELQNKIIEDYMRLKMWIIDQIFDKDELNIKLKTLITEINLKNKSQENLEVLSVSNKLGFIKQSEQFEDRNIASENKSNYKVISMGQYAYNPARINVGSIARLNNYEKGIISPMYTCFELNEEKLNPTYFNLFLKSKPFKMQLNKRLEGSVRQCLTFDGMLGMNIPLPSIQTQNVIANRINSLDKKIQVESSYLLQLKQQKCYLLDNLFI